MPHIAREPEDLGLRPEIKKDVMLSSATSFQECVNNALMSEQLENEIEAATAQPKNPVFPFRKPNFMKKGEGSNSAKRKRAFQTPYSPPPAHKQFPTIHHPGKANVHVVDYALV